MFKVYAFVNQQSQLADINSDAFIGDTTGWVQIDEGDGDRYMHAQCNYMPKPLTDEQGRYRYKLVDGTVVERTADKILADVLPVPEPTETECLTAQLAQMNTDFQMFMDYYFAINPE